MAFKNILCIGMLAYGTFVRSSADDWFNMPINIDMLDKLGNKQIINKLS